LEKNKKSLQKIDFTEGYFFPFITPEIRGYTSVSKDTFTWIWELQEENLFWERKNFLLEPSYAKLIGKTRIDLWAIGKGYAADCGRKFLEEKWVKKAIINLWWDISVFGFSSESPAILWIQDPRKREEIVSRISLCSGSVATSGIYLRKWKYKGEIQEHIFQPKEGEMNLISVSITDESCATADAIATALIAMWQKKAQEFSQRNQLNAYLISK
jgi:FAD:protein FMN transferase